jgi:hypothetical protein
VPFNRGSQKSVKGRETPRRPVRKLFDLHEGEAGGEGSAFEDAGVIGGEGVGVAEDAGPAGGVEGGGGWVAPN